MYSAPISISDIYRAVRKIAENLLIIQTTLINRQKKVLSKEELASALDISYKRYNEVVIHSDSDHRGKILLEHDKFKIRTAK